MSVVSMGRKTANVLDDIKAAISDVFLGRSQAIDLALICLLSDGHLN